MSRISITDNGDISLSLVNIWVFHTQPPDWLYDISIWICQAIVVILVKSSWTFLSKTVLQQPTRLLLKPAAKHIASILTWSKENVDIRPYWRIFHDSQICEEAFVGSNFLQSVEKSFQRTGSGQEWIDCSVYYLTSLLCTYVDTMNDPWG